MTCSYTVADTDACLASPCKNGGICKDLVNSYECECRVGYSGPNCEIGTLT